ncbi:MAG: flagellar M-ring protein FliF [Firmicutes bacterium]|nr:flagellar M-ring protein FliF [Bacillota bacterium]
MKELLEKAKEISGKLSKRTKKLIIITAIAVLIGAIAIAAVLNHKEYTVLYSDVNSEEATEIMAKLSELQIEHKYNGEGDILVDSAIADSTRATLAYEGYPKSGFTYDVFINNSGGMTTDDQNQTYKLYDLQNRIGATIRLFEGVKDARVTVALGNDQKYVLDENASKPSASVTVITKAGYQLTAKQAEGIQRLVAYSVPKMEMSSVVVLDETGVEVSTSEEANTSGDVGEEIARIVEGQITRKVWNVLEPFYGGDNVRISSNVKINMEKVIRETITYTTPDKIDQQDKEGIVKHETIDIEASGVEGTAGGVVGTEENSDIPQYVANAIDSGNGYYSNIIDRDYLVNQVKEQGELASGAIENQTISVSINKTKDEVLSTAELRELIGNAAGIPADEREEKISIAIAPFYSDGDVKTVTIFESEYFPYIAAGAVVLILLLILIIILLVRRNKKKKKLAAEEAAEALARLEEERLLNEKQEILNMKNERSMTLRESVREFAEENPEIAATMIKTWLHGGENNGK